MSKKINSIQSSSIKLKESIDPNLKDLHPSKISSSSSSTIDHHHHHHHHHQLKDFNDHLNQNHSKLDSSHWLPFIFIILPQIASIIFDNEPESWTDNLIFILIIFLLFKIYQVPWSLYNSTHNKSSKNSIHQSNSNSNSNSNLNKIQLIYLILALFSPLISTGLLIYLKSYWNIGLNYFNSNSIILFLLSSLVKPLNHLHHHLLNYSHHLKNQIQFPNQSIHQLNSSINQLSNKIHQIDQITISKLDLKNFKNQNINLPLNQLSTLLETYQRNHQLSQLKSASKLSQLDHSISQLNDRLDHAQTRLINLIKQINFKKNNSLSKFPFNLSNQLDLLNQIHQNDILSSDENSSDHSINQSHLDHHHHHHPHHHPPHHHHHPSNPPNQLIKNNQQHLNTSNSIKTIQSQNSSYSFLKNLVYFISIWPIWLINLIYNLFKLSLWIFWSPMRILKLIINQFINLQKLMTNKAAGRYQELSQHNYLIDQQRLSKHQILDQNNQTFGLDLQSVYTINKRNKINLGSNNWIDQDNQPYRLIS